MMMNIDANIQARVDRMRRKKAERQADLHATVAIRAMDRCNRVTAEKIRLQEQNVKLMQQLHAVSGYPVRTMLEMGTI